MAAAAALRAQLAGAALIIIDVQMGWDQLEHWGGQRNNPQAEHNISLLLGAWRAAKSPVVHVQHLSLEADSPLRADRPGSQIRPEAAPLAGEAVMQKHVNSAFIGTELEQWLRGRGLASVAIAGLTTDHCVSTTTRMAANLGFRTLLVADACATFDRQAPDGRVYPAQLVHEVHLASLRGEFATIVQTQDVLAALGPDKV